MTRPSTFQDFIGQAHVITELSYAIRAAQDRQAEDPFSVLDHMLFSGPAGLGKTTLAKITGAAFGREVIDTTGQTLSSVADLTQILIGLRAGDVLFIDEIHRMPKEAQDAALRAMEDRQASITVGKGENVKIMTIALQPFTLIAATTRQGLLAHPFIERFTHHIQLEPYSEEEIGQIMQRAEPSYGIELEESARELLASVSRGTPRVALRMLRKMRDFIQVNKEPVGSRDTVLQALQVLRIGPLGITSDEVTILEALVDKFDGRPVGLGTLAAMMNQERDTIEDMEDYLLRLGMINRTPRGRVATSAAYEYLGRDRGLRSA